MMVRVPRRLPRVRMGIFTHDTFTPALERLFPEIDAAVDLVFEMAKAEAESYAKLNAPWTDQTGNARAGLFAEHHEEYGEEHRLVIRHTMHYGIYLETRNSGKYAIIVPTLRHMTPIMSRNIRAAVARAMQLRGRGRR